MEWNRKYLFYVFGVLALFIILVKAKWRRMYKIIPRISPKKHWPSVLISSVTFIALLAVIIFGYVWMHSNTTKMENGFWSLEHNTRQMEKQVDSTMDILSSLDFKTFNSFTKELPGRLYILYAMKEEEIYKKIEKIFYFNHDEFKKLEDWTYTKDNKCVEEKPIFLYYLKRLLSTNDGVIFKELDVFIVGKIRELFEEFREEKLKLDTHLKSTKSVVDGIARPFQYATKDFTTKLLKSTEEKNYEFKAIYILPAVVLVYALCMETINTLMLSHVQVEQELTRSLSILFYVCSLQCIGLILFEIFSFETCHPEGPFFLQDIKLPSFREKSIQMASEAFSRCSVTGENFFLTQKDGVSMSYDSMFLKHVVDKYVDGVNQFFEHEKILEPTFLQHKKNLRFMNNEVDRWVMTCPDAYQYYHQLLNQTMRNLDDFPALTFGEHSAKIATIAKTVITSGIRRLTHFLHAPVKTFNDSLHNMNFDCHTLQEAYVDDFYKSCSPLNHNAIDNLKFTIIFGSLVCAMMHLVSFRRTDFGQFFQHEKVNWAKKYFFEWNEEQKNIEWKKTNNRSPDGCKYTKFKQNKNKNRYADIKCIDQTRVVLNNHSSDYIHANWIELPNSPEKYICSQAPLPTTFADFWHMIHQEEVKVIVQMCGFIENDIRICHLFFPFNVSDIKIYGKFQIRCTKIEEAPKIEGVWLTFARTFEMTNLADSQETPRIVKHIWLQNYFDECVPKERKRMLFLYEWTMAMNDVSSPIVSLCDTGSGRAGTFVAFAYAKRLLEQNRLESIAEVVNSISMQRWGVIDSFLEYLYLHAILAELLIVENYLHFEDCQPIFAKYQKFWDNRIGMIDRKRGNAGIQTHYWPHEYDPSFFEESENLRKAKIRIEFEKITRRKSKKSKK